MKNVEWIFEVLFDIEKFAEVNGLESLAKSLRAMRETESSDFGEVEKLVKHPNLHLVSCRRRG